MWSLNPLDMEVASSPRDTEAKKKGMQGLVGLEERYCACWFKFFGVSSVVIVRQLTSLHL